MIIRALGGKTIITSQMDHAWASGEISRALADGFSDEAWRPEVLRLVSHHDDGWEEWEQAAAESSLLPPNFTQLSDSEHQAIWLRGIDLVRDHLGPFSGAVLARHAQAVGDEKDPLYHQELSRRFVELSREAMPNVDVPVRDWHFERALQVLQLCDLLTLVPCAGWDEALSVPLLDDDGRHLDITIRSVGAWELEVDPWPFTFNDLGVNIPVMVLEHPDEWPTRAESFLAGKRSMQLLQLRPAALTDSIDEP